MLYRYPPKPILAKTPGLFSREEFTDYLNVGKNESLRIARRFSIPEIEGHFAERTVWRQLFGIEPDDAAATDLLRLQLQDINWMSRETGRATSTIRNRIKSGEFEYSAGVQLGDTSRETSQPRLRRWMPWQVPVAKGLTEAPTLRLVAPVLLAFDDTLSEVPETVADIVVPPDPRSVFSAIAAGNAG